MNKLSRALGVLTLGIGLTGCWSISSDLEEDDPPPVKRPRDAGVPDSGRTGFVDAGFGLFPMIPAPARLSSLITAERPPPALSGGTLAVSADGSIAVAADPDRDVVHVITLATEKLADIQLPTGSEPGRVVIDGSGRAHVALRGAGALLSIDLNTAAIIKQTAVCSLPRGLAYDAKADAVVIACASGELFTLSAADHGTISNKNLELDLRDVVLDQNGAIAVSRYRSAELLRVNGEGELLTKAAPLPHKQQRFDFNAPQPQFDADGGLVMNSVTSSPTLAWKTVASPGGGALMLHQQSQDDEVSIAESDGGLNPLTSILGGGGGGYGGGCQTITTASITRYSADGVPSESVTMFPHGLAVDIAISADGEYIALAEPGSYLKGEGTFEVLSKKALEPFQNGVSFDPIALPDGGFDFGPPDGGFPDAGFTTPSCMSGSVGGSELQASAVAFDDKGTLYVFSREPARLQTFTRENLDVGFLSVDQEIVLSTVSVRDTGHELFHADVGSGLSCASCHGEALDDGHVWNFRDFGPRRTQTMRGGFLSTLPLHWEGDLPDFKHLVDEVMTRRMGGFEVQDKYVDALSKWIDQLPPVKLGTTSSAGAIARGKALFDSEEVACASCHSGTHLTNNTSVDVGTGGVFQVPTLLGLALHPPFLHDGCAATLEARFDPSCGGGDKHGHTSHLSASDVADLVSYLNTL